MAANTQFAIAVHLMAGLAFRCSEESTTSAQLAMSVNTTPSFVRRTLAKLSKAGLVQTTTGKSGCCRLARDAKRITLIDVYRAVDAPKAFAIHNYPELKQCPVSCNTKDVLENVLDKSQTAVEKTLGGITLASIITEMKLP
jgi:Rrf2 family protein